MNLPNFEEALQLLRQIVKESHLEGQKHLDINLLPAIQQQKCLEALMVVQGKVESGELTREQLLEKLGL